MPLFVPKKKKPHFMSPTILSFTKDNAFSIPNILELLKLDKTEKNAWLDLFLDITGIGRKLDNLVQQSRFEMDLMTEKIFPALVKMENLEKNMNILKKNLSKHQQAKLLSENYAFLTPNQIRMIYGENFNVAEFQKTANDQESILENEIKKLAAIEDGKLFVCESTTCFRFGHF